MRMTPETRWTPLRRAIPETSDAGDDTGDILSDLASTSAVPDTASSDAGDDALESLRHSAVEVPVEQDTSEDVLAAIAAADTPQPDTNTGSDDVLDGLRDLPAAEPEVETSDDVLSDLATAGAAFDDAAEDDAEADVLDGLRNESEPAEQVPDMTDGVLSGLADSATDTPKAVDDTPDVLESLRNADETPGSDEDETDSIDDVLMGLEASAEEDANTDTGSDILDALRDGADDLVQPDTTDDVLGDLLGDDLNTVEEDVDPGDDILDALTESDTAGAPDPAAASEPSDTASAIGGDSLDDLLGTSDGDAADTSSPDAALPTADPLDDILADPDNEGDSDAESSPEIDTSAVDPLDDILGEGGTTDVTDDAPSSDPLDDILGTSDDGSAAASAPDSGQIDDDPLAGLLDDVDASDPVAGLESEVSANDGSDDPDPVASAPVSEPDPLDDLLGDLGGETEDNPGTEADTSTGDPIAASGSSGSEDVTDDLDALLGGLDDTDEPVPEAEASGSADTALDDLLGDIGGSVTDTPEPLLDTAASDTGPVGDIAASDESTGAVEASEGEDDLDSLLGDLTTDEGPDAEAAAGTAGAADAQTGASADTVSVELSVASGVLSGARPDAEALKRDRFRIAIFGDFTGRSAAGKLEIGDALAERQPIPLDVDEIEEIIESFATTLTLPLGEGGEGIEVRLGELDDLHPDELFENVDLFRGSRWIASAA